MSDHEKAKKQTYRDRLEHSETDGLREYLLAEAGRERQTVNPYAVVNQEKNIK